MVKESVQNYRMSIDHISSNLMSVDSTMKNFSSEVFHEHVTCMSVVKFDVEPLKEKLKRERLVNFREN